MEKAIDWGAKARLERPARRERGGRGGNSWSYWEWKQSEAEQTAADLRYRQSLLGDEAWE